MMWNCYVVSHHHTGPIAGASYTGLAQATGANGPLLFAANCGNWTVGAFNKQFAPTALAGRFADAALPLQEPVSPIRYGAV
jgi:hypothetical protein